MEAPFAIPSSSYAVILAALIAFVVLLLNVGPATLNGIRHVHKFGKQDLVSAFQQDRREGIPQGLHGTIGNTPLFRLNALSDATGCDIFAKAEVCVEAVGLDNSGINALYQALKKKQLLSRIFW